MQQIDYHASHVGGNLWAVSLNHGPYQLIYVRALTALEAIRNAKVFLCKY